jgi:hypothetical protein
MLSDLLYTPAIQRLEEVAQILLASAYLTAAAAVILLYDHIITLSDGKRARSILPSDSRETSEIEYVWSSPLSVAATMFYLVGDTFVRLQNAKS